MYVLLNNLSFNFSHLSVLSGFNPSDVASLTSTKSMKTPILNQAEKQLTHFFPVEKLVAETKAQVQSGWSRRWEEKMVDVVMVLGSTEENGDLMGL